MTCGSQISLLHGLQNVFAAWSHSPILYSIVGLGYSCLKYLFYFPFAQVNRSNTEYSNLQSNVQNVSTGSITGLPLGPLNPLKSLFLNTWSLVSLNLKSGAYSPYFCVIVYFSTCPD